MGEVYLAQDSQLRRPVALKILPQEFTKDEGRLRRFEQEAHAASALNHPYIITIHEIGSEGDTHFIATEFIDGESLRQRMGREGMKLGEALEVCIQAASALAAAHESGIIHRDIKPENIMLRRDGYVKVLDFGLAKLTEKSPSHQSSDSDASTLLRTDPGTVMGTAQYMSPEQARALPVDERTDVWSLGCVLYEMVAGRAAFRGETASHIIVSILENNPARLTQVRPSLPAELERIVEKALQKDRDGRYQTAKDMMLDLRTLKQRLEFNAEMERSAPVDIDFAKRAAKAEDRATAETIIGSDARASATERPRAPLSIQRIFDGLKSHRKAALGAALMLLAIVSLAIYFYSKRPSLTAKPAAATPASEAAIDSIAVLPLVNVGANPDTEYLSDGITDGLINSLAKLPKLKVIARSSVFQYKGKEVNPQEVARQLNVRAIVTGRLEQKGDGLSISVELTDVTSNRQLWGEQYNRKLSDILAVQQEIKREISEKLRLKLTSAEEKQLLKRPTDNDEAYRLFLLGDYQNAQLTIESIPKGIELLKQSIDKDPDFALAHFALAVAYYNASYFSEPRKSMPKAKEAALKSLQIDNNFAEGYSALALVKFRYDYDFSGAERDFRRGIELNPGAFNVHAEYGTFLAIMNRPEEASRELQRADELDPLALMNKVHLGMPYIYSRDYDKAIALFQKAVDVDPAYGYAHYWLGGAYMFKGMHEKAIEEFKKASLPEDDPGTISTFGMTYARWGKRAEAQKALDKLNQLSKKGYVAAAFYANIYAALGEKEQALDWLEKAYEYRDPILTGLRYEPTWDALRSEPRFIELLRKTGHSP